MINCASFVKLKNGYIYHLNNNIIAISIVMGQNDIYGRYI